MAYLNFQEIYHLNFLCNLWTNYLKEMLLIKYVFFDIAIYILDLYYGRNIE